MKLFCLPCQHSLRGEKEKDILQFSSTKTSKHFDFQRHFYRAIKLLVSHPDHPVHKCSFNFYKVLLWLCNSLAKIDYGFLLCVRSHLCISRSLIICTHPIYPKYYFTFPHHKVYSFILLPFSPLVNSNTYGFIYIHSVKHICACTYTHTLTYPISILAFLGTFTYTFSPSFAICLNLFS